MFYCCLICGSGVLGKRRKNSLEQAIGRRVQKAQCNGAVCARSEGNEVRAVCECDRGRGLEVDDEGGDGRPRGAWRGFCVLSWTAKTMTGTYRGSQQASLTWQRRGHASADDRRLLRGTGSCRDDDEGAKGL